MKEEDFNKWLNTEGEDTPENEAFEKDMFLDVYELRLKEQFKLELQTRRLRRLYRQRGLMLVGFLSLLGFVGYLFWYKKPTVQRTISMPPVAQSDGTLKNSTVQKLDTSIQVHGNTTIPKNDAAQTIKASFTNSAV